MNQLTLIDKIKVLFELLFSSPIIIGIFGFSLVLMILLIFSARINKKIIKYIFIAIYVGIIGFAVVKYGNYFLTSIDSFLTLFMANIYFPIIPIYVVIMLISFIIMIITLSGKNKSRFIKIINIIFFTIIQMLFAVFIYVIEANNIDLSTNTSLYSNEQTMTLLELGMGFFVVWIIVLLIIFYLKKADKIFKVNKNDEQDDFDEYINDYNEPSSISNSINSISVNNNIVDSIDNSIGPMNVNNNIVDSIDNSIGPMNVNNDIVDSIDNSIGPMNVNNDIVDSIDNSIGSMNVNNDIVDSIDNRIDPMNVNNDIVDSIDDSIDSMNVNNDIVDSIDNRIDPMNVNNDIVDSIDDNESINIVESLVPEVLNNFSSNDQYISDNSSSINSSDFQGVENSNLIKPDVKIDNTNVNSVNNSFNNVFENFEFLNTQNYSVERKDDDVEVLDFD